MSSSELTTKPNSKAPLTYKDAGVDIDAGDALVQKIKSVTRRTTRPEVLGGLGGFGGAFEIPSGYQQPVLVSGTDGVGTKLRLAMQLGIHNSIGIDLVAMCVNDLIVTGAEPLFFLDYYATGQLSVDTAADVISGIGRGCEMAGCALIGGETAEMPGMYEGEDYDLAGFCVGIVEKSKMISGDKVGEGDVIVGLRSSGVHSNGFSLVRKIVERAGADLGSYELDGTTLGKLLLEPTRIYVPALLKLIESFPVHGMAHITGGGLTENLPRVFNDQLTAEIDRGSWEFSPLFNWLQSEGQVETSEMLRTFNCGVGMCLILPGEIASDAIDLLNSLGEDAWQIGRMRARQSDEAQVTYVG